MLPFPSPGDLPNPGIEPSTLSSPELAGRFFTTSTTWEEPQNSNFELLTPQDLSSDLIWEQGHC